MQVIGRQALTAVAAVLLLVGSPLGIHAQWAGITTNRVSIPNSISPQSICPSRSINYITQTLPQQCLRTSWTREAEKPQLGLDREEVAGEFSHRTASETQIVSTTIDITSEDSSGPYSKILTDVPDNDCTMTTSPPAALSSSSTTYTASQSKTTIETAPEIDGDSPLDKANFLSFEEWKKQNLAKAGQSADNVGGGRAGLREAEPLPRPGLINNALDSLGEDTEIEIDFGGFVSPGVARRAGPSHETAADPGSNSTPGDTSEEMQTADFPSPHSRRKDAGKTCKERSNYASFDCAATVLKTNPQCKGSNSVLVENKDSYMLNECSAGNKFFIVELCNDILIDTIVLANFEFFSSMFRTFKVSVSDRYPVKLEKWRDLGTFEARNSREVQAFLVENPLIWARYLRVEFLTHFGNEYYCPVSLLRVHGTTMMEEFNHDVKSARGEEDPENEVDEGEDLNEAEPVKGIITAEALKDAASVAAKQVTQTVFVPPTTSTVRMIDVASVSLEHAPISSTPSGPIPSVTNSVSFESCLSTRLDLHLFNQDICKPTCASEECEADLINTKMITSNNKGRSVVEQTTGTNTPSQTSPQVSQKPRMNDTESTDSLISIPLNTSDSGVNKNVSISPVHVPQSSVKPHPSSTQPLAANPTTQESFFKSVHKRLQLLESNSTLSLQYIEEQSRILRDAFSTVEKRQLAKTTAFLDTLNSTVLKELREFRYQYDQIWQSTVIELSSQRETSQNEVIALSARLSLLADENLLQKRIAILQLALIVLCLGLIILSRGSAAGYLEIPHLIHNGVTRSSANLPSRYMAHFETPSASPPSTRPSSRYGIFGRGNAHDRNHSEDSTTLNCGTKRPSIEYSPPTPTSQLSSEGKAREEDEASEFSSESIEEEDERRKTNSGPVTPSGHRRGQKGSGEGVLLRPAVVPGTV